ARLVRLTSAAATLEIDRLEADSRVFRSLTIVLILASPIYILCSFRDTRSPLRLAGVVLALVPVGALRCYVESIDKKYKRDKNEEKQEAEDARGTPRPVAPQPATGQTRHPEERRGSLGALWRIFGRLFRPLGEPHPSETATSSAWTGDTRTL